MHFYSILKVIKRLRGFINQDFGKFNKEFLHKFDNFYIECEPMYKFLLSLENDV